MTVVEDDLKDPFSLNTTSKCQEERYSFPGLRHFTLDPNLIMLSIKQFGIKYHFWVFGITGPVFETQSPGALTNTLSIGQWTGIHIYIHIYIYIYMYTNIHIYTHIYKHICVLVYIYIHIYKCICIYMCMYKYAYIYIHLHIYIYIYIYTHI